MSPKFHVIRFFKTVMPVAINLELEHVPLRGVTTTKPDSGTF